jgi:hypothetical protein
VKLLGPLQEQAALIETTRTDNIMEHGKERNLKTAKSNFGNTSPDECHEKRTHKNSSHTNARSQTERQEAKDAEYMMVSV